MVPGVTVGVGVPKARPLPRPLSAAGPNPRRRTRGDHRRCTGATGAHRVRSALRPYGPLNWTKSRTFVIRFALELKSCPRPDPSREGIPRTERTCLTFTPPPVPTSRPSLCGSRLSARRRRTCGCRRPRPACGSASSGEYGWSLGGWGSSVPTLVSAGGRGSTAVRRGPVRTELRTFRQEVFI